MHPTDRSRSTADTDGGAASHAEIDLRGDEPAARCPYCGRPFRERRLEALHRGFDHPDRLSDRDRAAFERAYLEERTEIRRYRLLALGAVILCYFCFLFVYALVL
ncbi:hypothetical protein HTZ84_10950 [Haloterrigena sp. SYSU A558-1]|uniref:C2H2-type domain-containing protein n=1 Tax=Haloterrigena gelatinilytica TaxID=2741724 RepID=A0A8J8GP67_9EURY|nr:hypothetical protein [Haloterrigena gelatinilytica]NUB91442.1 hypothetical protein [Haloterrigena gelatinilytica]NUC72820.1 hypothetical protein [Haloterrigena gelatinilytica]